MIAKFLFAHWGKILALFLAGLILFGVVKLYNDNKDLIGQIVLSEDLLARCQATRERLITENAENLKKLRELQKRTEAHVKEVQKSRDEVERIARERESLLREIEEMQLPEDIKEKFDWLVEQAIMIRERRE